MSDDNTSYFPPSGLDRADGLDGFPGTPTPVGTAVARQVGTPSPSGSEGDGSFFEEDDESPEFDFGEQGTVAKTFETDENTFYTLLHSGSLARGQYYVDSENDISRVLSSSAKWLRGNRVKLRMTMEGINWGIPPDEFTIEAMDANPDLMKHPRYNDGSLGATGAGLTPIQKGIIRAVLNSQNQYNAADAFNILFNPTAIAGLWAGGPVAWPGTPEDPLLQKKMAWEIVQAYWRGEDTFYLPALRVTWSRFYAIPLDFSPDFPGLNPGGYVEDPVASNIIPYYFWSFDGTDNSDPGNNILQKFATSIDNLYAKGASYLRQCDQLVDQRTWYKLTSVWLGAPTGPVDSNGNTYIYWDRNIYTPAPAGATLPYPPFGPLPPPPPS